LSGTAVAEHPKLQDAGRTGKRDEQDSEDRRQQQRHAHGQVAVGAEEGSELRSSRTAAFRINASRAWIRRWQPAQARATAWRLNQR
jgi:hypothetical protein